jgi:hypothetical protein
MMNMRVLAVAPPLLWLNAYAFDPGDLEGATPVARGRCAYQAKLYTCFLLEKDSKLLLVPVDSEGAVAIWTVKERKVDYTVDDLNLLWSRDGI